MKKIALAISLAALAGCMNLTIRPQCDYNMGPYYCTKLVNNGLSRGFDGKPLAQMLVPVLLIDWPFDATVDTLLWPWDAWRYSKRFEVK